MLEQSELFLQDTQSAEFAELCNALYQRECAYLANHGPRQIALLQRKLKHLHTHITYSAHHLLHSQAPLKVDIHNASYHSPQTNSPPIAKQTANATEAYYLRHQTIGLVVPIIVNVMGTLHIEIDSIDKLHSELPLLHLNKFGWFSLAGESTLADGQKIHSDPSHQITLLKPTKRIMTSACCGHRWSHKGKAIPRVLTMRELRLSFNIEWTNIR